MLLKVQYYLVKVDVYVRGRCSIYGLGTWFQLDRLCSATQFPVHIMIFPDTAHMPARESLTDHLLEFNTQNLFLL